jgi:hypothetical protein
VLPQGVDWDFITERERFMTNGYVPPHDRNSGTTIASGLDLGWSTADDLRSMGIAEPLVERFTPYLGLRGDRAREYRTAHPLNVTEEEARDIDARVFTTTYDEIARRYNEDAAPGMRFEQLPREYQTAIVSLGHNYGRDQLERRAPNFWRQVTAGQWEDAYNNLMDFQDDNAPRRELEAAYMLPALERDRQRRRAREARGREPQ